MKAWIPNAITLLNLFCGIAAIIAILDQHFIPAFWFLFAAGLFDFADGLVARWLKVSSEHGKELDSLADMVSFGVVPGVIYYVFLATRPYGTTVGSNTDMIGAVPFQWVAAPALLISLFSALRLAKFNLDTRQSDDFIGLATPSSTLYAVGLMLIHATDALGWGQAVTSPWLVYPSIVLMSALLVSEIPMFSFKFKGLRWAGNEIRLVFLTIAILLLLVLQQAAFPFIVISYLILNIASWLWNPKKNKKA